MRWLGLVAVAGCGVTPALPDGSLPGEGDALVIDAPHPRVDPLVDRGDVQLVDGGYQFLEGPQWRPATGDLLFSDIPGNTIYRLVPNGSPNGNVPTVFRAPSGNSNGLALDRAGVLIACEHGNRRVSRGAGANPETVVDRFEGARLNSPNDAVVRGDDNLYFTDPPFGISDNQRELAFMGTFRVDPSGAITAVRRGGLDERPNGLALSPDGRTLYVGDAANATIYAYDLSSTGEPSGERMFAVTGGTPDGMAVDIHGNLFVATERGIQVIGPDGFPWGAIEVPEQPANAAFGDPDHRTLYITARTSLYRVRLANPGIP